jgi:hypothetical protein
MSPVGHVPSRDAEFDMHVCAGWANHARRLCSSLWVVGCGCGLWFWVDQLQVPQQIRLGSLLPFCEPVRGEKKL